MMSHLPAVPGSYLLRLYLDQSVRLSVGRLGGFDFPAGDYLYAGSAHGPGGLAGRLKHHLQPAAHPHWHLDWLRQLAQVRGGWYAEAPGSLECVWSQKLLRLPEAVLVAPGFGAADCRSGCPAHLVGFSSRLDLVRVENLLRSGPASGTVNLVWFETNPSA